MDRLKELHDFVVAEIDLFHKLPPNQFNEGVLAGFCIVKGYAESAIEMEGTKIAEALDDKV